MKKLGRLPFATLSLTLTTMGLTACTSLFGDDNLKVRPIDNISGITSTQRDPYYESAVTAINERDYARALNYLQEARTRDPQNVKILNGLGVVYDKLGRFDLSARYYTQARAAEPGSTIVAANIGYSRVLQGLRDPAPSTSIASVVPSDQKSALTISSAITASSVASEPAQPSESAQPPRTDNRTSIEFSPRTNTSVPFPQPVQRPVFVASIPAAVVAPIVPAMDAKDTGGFVNRHPVDSSMGVPSPSPITPTRAVLSETSSSIQPDMRRIAPTPEKQPAVPPLAVGAIADPAPLNLERNERSRPPAILARPAKLVPHSRSAVSAGLQKTTALAQPAKATPPFSGNKKVLTIGKPVKILNGSGARGGVEIISRRLIALGWTVRPNEWRVQAVTTLYYPIKNVTAARALQRTLPFPARLTADSSMSATMRLVIGKDYLSWRPRNSRLAALWQNRRVIASLQNPSTRGAR